jgi:hypothetical protein
MTEMEAAFDLEISLDLEDREIVLSSPPRDDGLMKLEPAMKPAAQSPALSEDLFSSLSNIYSNTLVHNSPTSLYTVRRGSSKQGITDGLMKVRPTQY